MLHRYHAAQGQVSRGYYQAKYLCQRAGFALWIPSKEVKQGVKEALLVSGVDEASHRYGSCLHGRNEKK